MIRVAIADDHRLLLEGLAEALSAVPDIEVVGTAGDGESLLRLMEAARPEVMLVDLEMPVLGGLEALQSIDEPPPTIIVTMYAGDDERLRAAAAGAVGFLSKSTPLPDLAAAVRAANAGETFMDAGRLAEVLDRHREPVLDSGAAALTKRERELLATLASGVTSTEELADLLFISQKTVKNHLANIYEKLAVSDRAQAAVEAIRLGFAKRPH
jgi:DNA-binding NarL/FixJ family response regulator